MIERITTGNANLDRVLGGGLPKNAINIVMGLPGSGKTLLAQQCVFSNADPKRPALYLSTASEPFDKILKYVQPLSFYDPDLIGNGVIYDELGTTLTERGLTGAGKRITELRREHLPKVLVIDSFKAFGQYAENATELRNFLHDLAASQSVFPVTSLWLGEYEHDELGTAPEFAVADSIVELTSHIDRERSSRMLEVFKLRGSGFLSGKHSYRLSDNGMDVYPRLADPGDPTPYARAPERASSGVQALDDMLDEGYRTGSSTLMAGPTGTGKTLMGLHFLFGGIHQGDHGIMANFQEDPSQLEQIAQGFGWSMANDELTLMYRSPVDLYLDQWVYEALDYIKQTGARRLFVDSLNDLESATSDPERFGEFLYSFLRRCARSNVSVLMSYEVRDLFGTTRLTDKAASNLSDNVVLLQYTPTASTMHRTLTVLKTRGSTHDPNIRRFEITRGGIKLAASSSWLPRRDAELGRLRFPPLRGAFRTRFDLESLARKLSWRHRRSSE